MGRKISLFLVSILLVSIFSATASAKIGLELRGGLALISPDEYNNGVLYVNPLYNDFGFKNALVNIYNGNDPLYNNLPDDISGSSLAQMFDGSALISIFFGDSFAVKLRGEGLHSDYDDIVSVDGEDVLYSHTILVTTYFGAGVSYYFNLSPKLAIYVSGDGGMFLNINSFYEVGSFTEASDTLNILNLPQGSYSADFTESFFGGHGELGVQLLLSEAVGVSLFGGYRYGVMPVTFPNGGAVDLIDANGDVVYSTSDRATNKSVFNATSIDISGPYFGAGIILYFGADKIAESGETKPAAAAPAAITKYEQYGDAYFKKKNYKYALQYYSGAYKLSPSAGLLKKIGFCYYYMKNKAKAMEYLQKYMQENPNDEQIKKWLGK